MDLTGKVLEMPVLPELTFDDARHIYRLDGIEIPSVSRIMEPLKDANYAGISERTLQRAADKGTSVHRHLQNGRLEWYSFDLKSMAAVLDIERRYTDKAKFLMIAFYIDLSGVGHTPFVDKSVICSLKAAIQKSGMDEYQVKGLYLDTVRSDTTPRHIMTVSDSLYLLELSLLDREKEVCEIIDNFRLSSHVE